MSSQVIIRVENSLKENFARLSRSEGKTTSQAMREMMEKYVQDRDFASYIDYVWGKISNDFKVRGVTEKQIQKTIKQVRKAKHDELNAGRH